MSDRPGPLRLALPLALAASLLLAGPGAARAQIFDRVKEAAEDALESEAQRQAERLLANAIRCALDDPACVEEAESRDEPVIFTDSDGEVIVNEEGEPITDREEAAAASGESVAPGEGARDNYDFEAGTDVLFSEDYAEDNVGDFPRRLEFVEGNWEVVEWEGRRLLRNLGPRYSALRIPLPETLPERFTIETEFYMPHRNQRFALLTKPLDRWGDLEGQYFQVGGNTRAGVRGRGEGTVESMQDDPRIHEELMPVRIMVDGTYAKVYVGENRVANVPNAEFERTDVLELRNTYFADEENPILIGPITVAAGGRDLYDVLEARGRVTVNDILFDTNEATIKPASAETLGEIASMLEEHSDLSLLIEGHTDDEGGFDHNMTLSGERADAVKAWLVEEHGIDAARLRTVGLGPTQPVADNASEEGRRQNRRVELVRVER